MKLLLPFLFVTLWTNLAAQTWFQGSVVLVNGEVRQGRIKEEFKLDLILFSADSAIEVYPAHKLRAIYYYDHKEAINRKFTVIQQSIEQPHGIYEIVVFGEASLLRHARHSALNSQDIADYFVMFRKCLISAKKFPVHIYPLLTAVDSSLGLWVDVEGVKKFELAGMIKTLERFNRNLVRNAQSL